MMRGPYRVRQTDCRTGWQVVSSNDRVYLTTRRRIIADQTAHDLNSAIRKPAPQYDPRIDHPERYQDPPY